MRDKGKLVLKVLAKVYANKYYILLSALAVGILPVATALAGNWKLVIELGRWQFVLNLVEALPYTIGWPSLIYLILTSLLFAFDLALAVYYFRRRGRVHAGGVGVAMLSLLGLGCAACGSLVVLPLLGTLAVGSSAFFTSVLAQVPFVAIVILIWSIYNLDRKIDNPYG